MFLRKQKKQKKFRKKTKNSHKITKSRIVYTVYAVRDFLLTLRANKRKADTNMKNTISSENEIKKLPALIKGVSISLILCFGLFLILALIMLNAALPEWIYPVSATTVGLVCSFAGGFVCAGSVGQKGWLWGGVCGILYYIIIYLCALSAFASFTFSVKTLLMLVFGFLCGSIGGLFAMGSRSKKRRR